ncbi:hypothetical protein JZU71_03680, partial [bacterium]|nr:hypothetical protein [bacterium]
MSLARYRFYLRCLVVCLVCIAVAGGAPLVQAANAGPSDQETRQIIDYLTASVPEIGELARQNPASRLVIAVEQ